MSATRAGTVPQARAVRRKPAPSVSLDVRYPLPDPDDPFAPLAILRTRTAEAILASTSTSFVPFPAADVRLPRQWTHSMYADKDGVTAWTTRTSFSRNFNGRETFSTGDRSLFNLSAKVVPADRKRAQSALSRSGTRCSSSPKKVSPYGHKSLKAYLLATTNSSPTSRAMAQPPQQSTHSLSPTPTFVDEDADARINRPKLSHMNPKEEDPAYAPHAQASELGLPYKLHRRPWTTASTSTSTLAPGSVTPPSYKGPQAASQPTRRSHPPSTRSRPNSFGVLNVPPVLPLMPSIDSSPRPPGAMGSEVLSMSMSMSMSDPDLTSFSDPGTSFSHSFSLLSAPISFAKSKPVAQRPSTTAGPRDERRRHAVDIARESVLLSPPEQAFDENALPTHEEIADAASYLVMAENGIRVPFGELFRHERVVFIFIRHFWCPYCQDYMASIASTVDPRVLRDAGVSLIIISNGSYKMIKSYRKIFRMPFKIYTDPALRVYQALGMGRRTGPDPQVRGSYIRHGSVRGAGMVLLNALRVGMPMWGRGGNMSQLGGEFVLGPGLRVSWAHRMPSARGHAPIIRVLANAGVSVYATSERVRRTGAHVMTHAEELEWMEGRRRSLNRMQQKKMARRLGVRVDACGSTESSSSEGDTEDRVDECGFVQAKGQERQKHGIKVLRRRPHRKMKQETLIEERDELQIGIDGGVSTAFAMGEVETARQPD